MDKMQTWEILVKRMTKMITNQGNEPVVINIESRKNFDEQLDLYKKTCKNHKSEPGIIVATSSPEGELIFWVNYDAEFLVDDAGKIKAYGNHDNIKKICNM